MHRWPASKVLRITPWPSRAICNVGATIESQVWVHTLLFCSAHQSGSSSSFVETARTLVLYLNRLFPSHLCRWVSDCLSFTPASASSFCETAHRFPPPRWRLLLAFWHWPLPFSKFPHNARRRIGEDPANLLGVRRTTTCSNTLYPFLKLPHLICMLSRLEHCDLIL
jgi:hypothetical protein